MPNFEVNDFVNDWMGRIKASLEYRQKHTSYKKWKDYRKYYRGEWDDSIIPVNRIFSLGRSLIPKAYFQAPRVTVTARRPEFLFHAKVLEEVDNMLIRETLLKGTLKRAILNTYLCGIGPIKLGYDSEFGFVPEMGTGADTETISQYGIEEQRKIEYNIGVKPGMPWALPTMPEDVIFPPGTYSASALPWVAHRILRPLSDVRQDSKYSNTASLKGTKSLGMAPFTDKQMKLFDTSTMEAMTQDVYCELFEVRDMRTGMIYTLCEDQILLSTQDILQVGGLPWEFLVFNEDPEHISGIPDVAMIEAQQLEINEIRTQASKHRKIALLKFLIKKGAIKDLEAFFSGEVGPGIEVEDEIVQAAVHMLVPHVPPDLWAEAMHSSSDMRESLGYSENETGSFSPYHGKTATETMQVAASNDARDNERKDIVADILINIVQKWNQYIFKLWDAQRVVPIVGAMGAQQWISFSGKELEAEYNLRVDPESGFPINKQLKMQMANGLIQQYGGDPQINQEALKQRHLEQYEWVLPGVSQLVKMLPPQMGDAMAQERQPNPMGISGASEGRTAGRTAGSVTEFAEAKKRFEGGSK